MAAMPNPKAAHYQSALTSALLRGAWAETNPGSAPNGTELSWGELIRKWGKHTGGNTALIHLLRDISLLYLSSNSHTQQSNSGFIPIPSATRITTSPPDSTGSNNTSVSASSFVHIPHPHRKTNSVDTATVHPIHTSGIAERAAYLSAGDLDGDDEESDTSWGIGRTWWVGVAEGRAEEVQEGVKALNGILEGGKLSAGEAISARLTLAYHLIALGHHERAIIVFEQADSGDIKSGIVDGDAAILERIRARSLHGLALELAQSPSPDLALTTYLSAIPLLRSLTSLPVPIPSYLSTTQTPRINFDSHRELYRHLSTLLSRAAIVSARKPNNIRQTLQILRTYHSYSSSWPAAFRPHQRQRMLNLYLRALLAGYPPANVPAESPYLVESGQSSLPARILWQKEVIEAMRLGRSLLSSTTTFPRAGSTNHHIIALSNMCVSLSDLDSSLTRDTITILWWSMTLTFQSQSILRHLTRLLTAVGDSKDAKRTFELYVQLVLKARQAQQPETNLSLQAHPNEDTPSTSIGQLTTAKDGEVEITEGKQQVEFGELDGDGEFVESLLGGARLLLRDLGDGEDAWRYVMLAGDVLRIGEERGSGLGEEMRGRVEECKGIVRMAMGMRGADPITRPTYQSQAINHLLSAITLHPTPETYYHLAYSQAEARSKDDATESIRKSLELDPTNVQAWHLLALLLTARGDWSGAGKACEAGVGIWEKEEDDAEETVGVDGTGGVVDISIETRDFASTITPPTPIPSNTSPPLLLQDGTFGIPIPPSQRFPPMSRTKKLENVINLRMTLNVITEKTQGPETAMLRQQELFAFFSARSGKNRAGGLGGLSASGSLGSVGKLGGSFISVDRPHHESGPNVGISVQPPTPIDGPNTATPFIIAPADTSTSASSSPGQSATSSEAGSRDLEEKGGKGHSGSGKKFLPKHLHVPHPHLKSSRPSSVRRLTAESIQPGHELTRTRTASASSTVISLAPTAAHSHYASTSPSPAPPPPPLQTSSTEHGRTPLESRILSNLWLMSAATFRRWSKPEQSLVSIEEAETLDPENPEVWIQLGLHHLSPSSSTSSSSTTTPNYQSALPAFTKSILLRPSHPSGVVHLAKLYLSTGGVELAHSLLNQLTQGEGWDVPEAWYWLGRVCEVQGGREGRCGECWEYALGLERSRTCRRLEEGVDRWL